MVPDYVGVVCGSAGALRWGTDNELDYGNRIVLIVDVTKDGETLRLPVEIGIAPEG